MAFEDTEGKMHSDIWVQEHTYINAHLHGHCREKIMGLLDHEE